MRKYIYVVAVLVVGLLPSFEVGSGAASAAPSWPSLLSQAESAISSVTQTGPVGVTETIGGLTTTSVETVSGGSTSAEEQTYEASIGGSDYFVGLTLLGGQQLLVDFWPLGSSVITVLTLGPGSSNVASATTLSARSSGEAPAAMAHPDVSNCYAIAYSPAVVASIYGPLIEGIGGAGCNYAPEVLGAIVSLYSNGSGVGSASGGSSSPNAVYTYIAPYDYAPCYSASSASPFDTAVIYSVSGSVAGGGSSGNSSLDCQP